MKLFASIVVDAEVRAQIKKIILDQAKAIARDGFGQVQIPKPQEISDLKAQCDAWKRSRDQYERDQLADHNLIVNLRKEISGLKMKLAEREAALEERKVDLQAKASLDRAHSDIRSMMETINNLKNLNDRNQRKLEDFRKILDK